MKNNKQFYLAHNKFFILLSLSIRRTILSPPIMVQQNFYFKRNLNISAYLTTKKYKFQYWSPKNSHACVPLTHPYASHFFVYLCRMISIIQEEYRMYCIVLSLRNKRSFFLSNLSEKKANLSRKEVSLFKRDFNLTAQR